MKLRKVEKNMKLLVQVIKNWRDPYNQTRETQIPSLDGNNLEKAIHYCEKNKITGVLYDSDSLDFSKEWYFIEGILMTKEKYEEIRYGH